MKYLDTKENSIEDSVTRVLMGEKKLDPVNPTAVKKKFDDRKDKDIDNDGDVDSTDKYLHKRRKAVSKAIKSDEKSSVSENVKDIAMMMRDKKYKGRTSAFDSAVKKKYPREYNTNAVQDLIKKHAEMNESIKNEGTWAMPDTPKLKMGLKKALQRPIMLGKEGDDATDTIRNFIGDDELYDDLYSAGMKNPKADARPIIKKAMKRLGIKEEIELDESEGQPVPRDKDGKLVAKPGFKRVLSPGKGYIYKRDTGKPVTVGNRGMSGRDNTGGIGVREDVELDENFRKLAMKGIGTETKKGARVGLKTDYYLPSNGDKSFGKIMRVSKDGYEIQDEKTKKTYKFKFYDSMNDPTSVRGMKKENYEIGNDYAKHTLRVTPGQTEDDVDEMIGIMQKKSTSMRETLAKMWGMKESRNPFEKKVNEKEDEMVKKVTKTMTGKKPTPVEVNPKVNESASSPPGSMDFQRYVSGLKQKLRSAESNSDDPNFGDEDYTDNLRDRIKKLETKAREASRPNR